MSADAAIPVPLPLGLLLATGGAALSLASDTLAVPITMQAAGIISSANAADVGITFPLILGNLLPTDGVSSYTTTSGAVGVPITMQGATLLSSVDSADFGVSWPLALGLNLFTSGYTLVSGYFECPIYIASAEPSEYETSADALDSGAGGRRRRREYYGPKPEDEQKPPQSVEQAQPTALKTEDALVVERVRLADVLAPIQSAPAIAPDVADHALAINQGEALVMAQAYAEAAIRRAQAMESELDDMLAMQAASVLLDS